MYITMRTSILLYNMYIVNVNFKKILIISLVKQTKSVDVTYEVFEKTTQELSVVGVILH